MKKIILSLILIFILKASADVLPYYINSLRRYGIGYTKVQSPLVLKREPKDDSEILETLNFDYANNASCLINDKRCTVDEIFSVYSKSKKLAFLTTMDETEGYNLVCFNQYEVPVCGWVNSNENKFYTPSEFFDYYGKKFGIYLFKDLKKTDKILYAAPTTSSNSTGSVELPKYISPWLINGNWMLVKVQDYGNKAKTGWINYRGNDGKLKVFVKF